jgi:DNA-binding NarL/FixJ family response regulator
LIFGEFPPAYAARARKHLRGLTNCEQEILDLVSDGQSNEVIASHLVHFCKDRRAPRVYDS